VRLEATGLRVQGSGFSAPAPQVSGLKPQASDRVVRIPGQKPYEGWIEWSLSKLGLLILSLLGYLLIRLLSRRQ